MNGATADAERVYLDDRVKALSFTGKLWTYSTELLSTTTTAAKAAAAIALIVQDRPTVFVTVVVVFISVTFSVSSFALTQGCFDCS